MKDMNYQGNSERGLGVSMVHRAVVIIPTFNAAGYLPALFGALDSQEGLSRDQVLVVDSSSTDGTPESFAKWGARVISIKQAEFDHGGTRRLATKLAGEAEFYVFLTQDAILASCDSIERLLRAFDSAAVGMAYGCQLPRPSARGIERHARTTNYPANVCETRTVEDRGRLGIKVVFCSDSFAAYRRSALESVGGVPESAFFAEDQIIAGRMLLSGWHLAYRGDARVTHSHDYSMFQEFKRYFDVGVFHARNSWLLDDFGLAEGEGFKFVASEMKYLWKHDRSLIFSAAMRTFLKYGGYRLGRLERLIGNSVKKHLSMSSYYWARQG